MINFQAFIKLIFRLVKNLAELWSNFPEAERKKAIELAAKLLQKYFESKYDEFKSSNEKENERPSSVKEADA